MNCSHRLSLNLGDGIFGFIGLPQIKGREGFFVPAQSLPASDPGTKACRGGLRGEIFKRLLELGNAQGAET